MWFLDGHYGIILNQNIKSFYFRIIRLRGFGKRAQKLAHRRTKARTLPGFQHANRK